MGRRRGFLPPATCSRCGNPPALGESLWPVGRWLCIACLEAQIPERDAVSKAMLKSAEAQRGMQSARCLDVDGQKGAAERCRNEARWARATAAELHQRGAARIKSVVITHGEAVPQEAEKFLHDTLSDPDLPALEASLDRSRLLLIGGADVAAMGLDASASIGANNSLEKMLAHQLAAVHKMAMILTGQASDDRNPMTQVKRSRAAARCMEVFQEGLLALQKLRHGGQQRITVQYVNVSQGGQAVIGNVEKSGGRDSESQPAGPTR